MSGFKVAAQAPVSPSVGSTPAVLSPTAWEGVWNAEQTLITIRVTRSGNTFAVEPIQSAGLVWTTRNGVLQGDTATIEVEYQGVTGRIMVQLLDEQTAIAHAMSCQPDYHVLCALVKNQQARFRKLESPPAR